MIDVTVTERFQTTVDPLMQRALGIRIMGAASNFEAARSLLDQETDGASQRWAGELLKDWKLRVAGPRPRRIWAALARAR